MIAYTNANTAKLPTTPPPAPQKSWDKRDRAKAAAIKALGPQAIPEFDFTVYKCDGRWLWSAIASDKRPPVSAVQIKANGGKKATEGMINDDDRLAGEAIATAALAKKTADKIATELMGTSAEKLAVEIADKAADRLAKAIDTTEDENGIPKFLKRGHETIEAQKARIEKYNRTTGPGRKINNPPDAEKSKERAKKEKKTSIAFVAKSAILAGKNNAKALMDVLSVFPNCGYKESDVQWYRRKLIKDGKLSESPKRGKSKR